MIYNCDRITNSPYAKRKSRFFLTNFVFRFLLLAFYQKYGFQGMMFGGGGGRGGGDGRNDGNVTVNGGNGGQSVNNQNGGGTSSESFRTDSSSPACASLSPPVKEESLEGHTSEEGDRDRICSPHDRSPPDTPGFRRE